MSRKTGRATRQDGKPVPLGWCLDGLHEQCIEVTPHLRIRCVCTCHESNINRD